jgi:transcription elongation factor GreA-like protein
MNLSEENAMADSQLAAKVLQMLNEEKWTRATLQNYSLSSLKELDLLIEEAEASSLVDELLEVCNEHLSHTKNSVIALYCAGIVSLR